MSLALTVTVLIRSTTALGVMVRPEAAFRIERTPLALGIQVSELLFLAAALLGLALASGRLIRRAAAGREITRRLQAEAALAESEATLKGIVETAVDAIVVIDDRGTIRSVNPAFERIFGYAAGEAVGENVKLLMPSPQRDDHDEFLARYMKDGVKKIIGIGREVTARRKDGSLFQVDLAVSEVPIGSKRLFAGVMRDITARVEMQETLRARVRQQETVAQFGLRALAGAASRDLMAEGAALVVGTLAVDSCGVFELDAGADRLVIRAGAGFDAEGIGEDGSSDGFDSLEGHTLRHSQPLIVEDFASESRFPAPRFLKGQAVTSGLSVVVMGGAKPFGLLSAYTARRRSFTQDDVHFLQSIANVLAQALTRYRQEEQLLKQESLARLGEMASVVAHEVKNPLAGISGALRILANRLSPSPSDKAIFDEILARMESLNTLVTDILNFARPRLPAPRHAPLRWLLEDLAALLKQDPRCRGVEVEVGGPDVLVHCDVELMRPVLFNIFMNAAQATDGRGKINVRLANEDGCSRIWISDDGPGIPAAIRSRLFEPFFTTKHQGTGLGLALAKRVVELHGGDIRIVCPEGGGTTVVIELPLPAADGQEGRGTQAGSVTAR
jgi:PAS domain S-box-containing protein